MTNANGEPVILNIDGTYASATITGQDDIEVAIVSCTGFIDLMWFTTVLGAVYYRVQ